MTYPRELGYTLPAEWESHRSCWLAWPWDGSLWKEDLQPAQQEFVQLCQAIQKSSTSGKQPESVYLMAPSPLHRRQAERFLGEGGYRYFEAPYGDIWLRDTGPIFVSDKNGAVAAVHFKFNGWGGKYHLAGDASIGQQVARFSEVKVFHADWILEGGSVETDGQGLCLTTRQCLLNPNRNPGMTEKDLERELGLWLGQEKVLWLSDGLMNDHTDGHIDNLARFVRPGVAVCMRSESETDPNRRVLLDIEKSLRLFSDRNGKPLEIVTIPSPGDVRSKDGSLMPASYMNFYISNTSVVLPIYGTDFDQQAVSAITSLFPDRTVIPIRANRLLTGGGSFHCMTQPFPGSLQAAPTTSETDNTVAKSEPEDEA